MNKKLTQIKNLKKAGSVGFALMELLVVISIISLLSSISIVQAQRALARARFVRIEDDLRQIATAAVAYQQDYGTWAPDTNVATPPQFLVKGYLNRWPTPPCKEWVYDWENYDVYSPDPALHLIRVTVRPNNVEATASTTANPSVLYYCIEDGLKDSCQWDDPARFPAGFGGGINFLLYKNQGITCREGRSWVTNNNQPVYNP